MLIDIGENAYYSKFLKDPHPFLSRKFIDLNKSKADQIFWLIDDNKKQSLGLSVGLKDGYLLSPFSAPFGGFHFSNELIYVSVINEFIQNLQYFINKNGLSGIIITLPPNIYHQTLNAKLTNCLYYCGFKIKAVDITSWVDMESYEQRFNENSSRRHLKQAINHGLNFKLATQTTEKQKAYELIWMNRKHFGRPIYMSFKDLAKMDEIWDIDYFVVCDATDEMVAASINYRVHKTIVYGVFWGDNEKGRPQRAMDFCIFKLLNHYKQSGYKYLDIGISTEGGIPNEGLLRFKEAHNATSSLRYTFIWNNE